MDNVELMQVGDARDDMFKKPAGLQFIQFGLFDYIVEEFALFDVLHHEEEVLGGFDDLHRRVGTS